MCEATERGQHVLADSNITVTDKGDVLSQTDDPPLLMNTTKRAKCVRKNVSEKYNFPVEVLNSARLDKKQCKRLVKLRLEGFYQGS